MSNSSTILTTLLLSWIFAGTATAQDEFPERKNAISTSVLPLLSGTYSLTYSRKLNSGRAITINPRVQFSHRDAATEPGIDQGSNRQIFGILVPDPQWFYDHYALRIGLRLPLGGKLGYEPQLQLGYGAFYNKVIKTDDAHGDAFDEYLRLDRTYTSAGVINMFNWITDYNRLRLNFFVGVGAHLKFFREMQYNKYIWYRQAGDFTPHEEYYTKWRMTLHGGMEIGYRF